MTPAESAAYLHSFIDFERDLHRRHAGHFRLDRMRRLLQAMGNPQDRLTAIHVAGSKGKGSTCVMAAHILAAAGYKTGLYTSPHLDSYHERIRILGHPSPAGRSSGIFPDSIPEQALADLVSHHAAVIDQNRDSPELGPLTFYEVFTALALLYFVQEKTDAVVLETGLGGRLDATNTVPAQVAVLTPIGLEHTDILGDTLAAIAAEKAAIIKAGQEVVVAPQHPEAAGVISRQCAQYDIMPCLVGPEMWDVVAADARGQVLRVRSQTRTYEDVRLGLPGSYQQANAVTAVCAAEAVGRFGLTVDQPHVLAGLAASRWPLRFERFGDAPPVIMDAAHSMASLTELRSALEALYPGRRIHAVVGMSADKNIRDMCGLLDRFVHVVYLVRADHPRAYAFSPEDKSRFFSAATVHRGADVKESVRQAVAAARPEDLVLVTGSVYAAAEARRYWINSVNGD